MENRLASPHRTFIAYVMKFTGFTKVCNAHHWKVAAVTPNMATVAATMVRASSIYFILFLTIE
jgi:hypothetical protein